MSTRSYIGISDDLFGTNEARCLYCQFDGYLEGVGSTLFKCYNSETLADSLTAKGSLDSLRETREKCDWYDEEDKSFRVKFDSESKDRYQDVFHMIDYRYVYDRKTQKWYEVEATRFFKFPAYLPLEDLLKAVLERKEEA